MKLMKIYDDLPVLYRNIFPEFFAQEIPVEEMATCSDCAMCHKPGTPAMIPGIQYFKPDIKCCTYYPKLPNYLVGGILSDPDPFLEEGRRRVRERIKCRVAVSPQALYFPKRYRLMHKHGMPQSFGRSSTMICPYYVKEGGLCSIWKFRDAACSTYFCKTIAGNEGQKFWKVVRGYLLNVEGNLCWYPLYKMNWDMEATWEYFSDLESGTLQPEDLDEAPPPDEIYQKIWGDWVGREEEFYRESYRMVCELTRDELDRITGITGNVMLSWLKEKYDDVMHPKIPPVLFKNPQLIAIPMSDGESYSIRTDVGFFSIMTALHDILNYFDGVKTTDEIKKIVLEEYQDELSDELIQSMYFNHMVLPLIVS
ncbi:hypothetical protein L0244_10875 [bacterium]|nr:hypothetical protein [bacterium]MCI0613481.1 hypothetical protein [bacterium]